MDQFKVNMFEMTRRSVVAKIKKKKKTFFEPPKFSELQNFWFIVFKNDGIVFSGQII